jgi:hypothetical protein
VSLLRDLAHILRAAGLLVLAVLLGYGIVALALWLLLFAEITA